MELKYNHQFPSIDGLRERAKKRIPRFAFEYLDGGCNEEINLVKNTNEIREIELKPRYLEDHQEPSLKTELFGHVYDAPFGIAPVGLQGLMWPGASEILAKAAFEHNIPFVLSTVATASIEKIAELTQGAAWFQLYYPKEEKLRNDIIDRAVQAGMPVLVLLCDVPTFGYRAKEIRNGLAIPPRMSLSNLAQIMGCPTWAVGTLLAGTPQFKTLTPYLPKGLSLRHLGLFMNKTFSGKLNEERIKPIRDRWKGKLVLKGVASEEDAEKALKLGMDGIIVSNHGGRQLDAGQSAIKALAGIQKKYAGKLKIMMDSGLRTGPDVARALARGAEFTFMGRSFMYGVAALGKNGGDHTTSILKIQLQQVMEQLCCETISDLSRYVVQDGAR